MGGKDSRQQRKICPVGGNRRKARQAAIPGSQRSIQIRFGERKGVPDHFHSRLLVACHDHFHHVKSEKNVRVIEHAQPRERAPREALAFVAIHCRYGTAEILPSARLDFHKHERVGVAANDVDLAAGATLEIAIENLVSVTTQESAGQFFAARPAPEMRRRALRVPEAVAPPARKSGDGSDKAQTHGVSTGAAQCSSPCAG